MPIRARDLAFGAAIVALAAACNALLSNSEHALEVADGSVGTASDSGPLAPSGADSSTSGAHSASSSSSGSGGFASGSGSSGAGSSSGSSSGGSSGSGSGSGAGSSSGSSSGAGSSGAATPCAAGSGPGSGCALTDGGAGICDLCGACGGFNFTLQCQASSCAGAPDRAPCALNTAGFGECCGGICTDLFADNGNCGACGQSCPGTSSCSNESCSQSCGTSAPCAAGQTCVEGDYCVLSSCAGASDGQACADPGGAAMCCGGECVSLSDPNNCGACGNTCASGICRLGVVFVDGAFGSIILCIPEPVDAGAGCLVQGGCATGEACIGNYCVTAQCNSVAPTTAYCAASDGDVGICV